jgi:outer membrane lipopolysaccharide assembly protein LptE/RlpB
MMHSNGFALFGECEDFPAKRLLRFAVPVLFIVFLPACGYHVAGRGALLPPDIKTIAVPTFKNETPQFKIEQALTSAVVKELIERTQFRVTTNPAEADAVLRGTVKRIRRGVVTFNPQTGSATTLQIEVIAGVTLVDQHTKRVVFSNPDYLFREQYQVSPTPSTLIEEDPAAVNRLSRDFAHTLVTDILENF